jgi:hypothetical protein
MFAWAMTNQSALAVDEIIPHCKISQSSFAAMQ